MSGVVFSVNAEAENDVVTCMLALAAQTAAHEPEQRIEPVNGARQVRCDLYQPVMAFDMCKFVDEDDADPVVRPTLGIGGQQHVTTKNAPGARHPGNRPST